jgi:2-phospho-L-lactate/phosphoenolpyruvate guanylyltransferase
MAPRSQHAPGIWALVPIRGLGSAKTRLRPDLGPEERAALVELLLRRTLIATRDAARIAGTIVVTKDPHVAAIASRHHAVGLVERLPGLNEAIEAARSVAVARGATAVLVLPADLPAVTAEALDALVAGADRVDESRLVLIIPDRHGTGTNALLLRPPTVADPAFGPGSRAAHAAAARAADAALRELGGPLSLDVDTPADLVLAESTIGPLHG